jgi:peptidoglycan/xylan/chitin deacetylase (PgdA/CDA1 family)
VSAFARRAAAAVLLPAASLHARWRPGIRILMYHRVDDLPAYDQLTVAPARFARQMAYLARHRRLLSLAEAVDELGRGGPARDGVVVTFDDGYRDNLVHALPVLRQHRIPATIFVTVAFCDQSQRHPRYPDAAARLHLDWEELRALAKEPLVTIGSHTLAHPYLPRLPPDAARAEIAESRERIGRQLGRPVEFFCYPSGDFGARELSLVREAGYRAAVTVAPGANRPGAPLLELRRTEVTDRDETGDLYAKLSGAYDLWHRGLHRRRRRRFEAAARAAAAAPAGGGR